MSDKRTAEEGRFAGLALAEEELVARVAWCYYHDGLTQNDIGERLGLPRLKISRLLEKGRQSGVIRVQINSRYEGCLALESELQQRFGLKIARVLPALNTPPMNTRLGIGAAQSLMGILQPGQLLAVGFGATNCCHPVAVQVSCGNLLAVLKIYVSVLPHHFTPFLLCFSAVDGKK